VALAKTPVRIRNVSNTKHSLASIGCRAFSNLIEYRSCFVPTERRSKAARGTSRRVEASQRDAIYTNNMLTIID
jgi:hypothetical protein